MTLPSVVALKALLSRESLGKAAPQSSAAPQITDDKDRRCHKFGGDCKESGDCKENSMW
jgi:hypothetical protein